MLKIDIRSIRTLNANELKNLLNLAKIDKNALLTYMERERWKHESTINDLTTIAQYSDDHMRKRAEDQRLEELKLSNSYYDVIKTLKPFDTRRPRFHKMGRTSVRKMADSIMKELDKKAIEKEEDKLEELFTLSPRKSVCAVS